MASYRRSEIISGLFVALALLVFGMFAFKVGSFDLFGLFGGDVLTARAYFLDIGTLEVGAPVKVGGRLVGEVSDLRLVQRPSTRKDEAGERVNRLVNEVLFQLTDPGLRIDPETAAVTIAQDSLLAPHFLKLDAGRWQPESPPPPIFQAGLEGELMVASREGGSLEDLLAAAGPAFDELLGILETVNDSLLGPANVEAVGHAVENLNQTLAGSRKALAALEGRVLGGGNLDALDRIVENLDGAVASGRQATASLEEILDADRDPRLQGILTDLAKAAGELDGRLAAVQADLGRFLEGADRSVESVEIELSEAARRLQEALWQGEMALRKIRANPAVLVFGDDETDLEATDLDLTEIRLRGRARPYEQRDEE